MTNFKKALGVIAVTAAFVVGGVAVRPTGTGRSTTAP